MTKEQNKDSENSTKCWICDNYCIDDFKVTDHCYITGKYKSSAHIDCNINVKLDHKILVVCHNLNNYDSHIIMQGLGKFNLKINVIPTGLEKYTYMRKKLNFLDNYQFLNSLLDSLIKHFNKDDFKYLS